MGGCSRSFLYVPGDRPEWLDTARAAQPDALILDLEDSVTIERKPLARKAVRASLEQSGPGQSLWIRIDTASLTEDIDVVNSSRLAGLAGVVVPKAEPMCLSRVDELLTRLEGEQGLAIGSLPVIALVETARGLQGIRDIAAAPRVVRLALGEADLAGDLGIQPDADRTELLPARFAVVVASAAAGLHGPLGPVHTVVDDLDGLARTTLQQLRLGFRGRTAIHPSQVVHINAAFTPSASQVTTAKAILDAYRKAVAAGHGAVRGPRGQLLDAATVRSAEEILDRAADYTT